MSTKLSIEKRQLIHSNLVKVFIICNTLRVPKTSKHHQVKRIPLAKITLYSKTFRILGNLKFFCDGFHPTTSLYLWRCNFSLSSLLQFLYGSLMVAWSDSDQCLDTETALFWRLLEIFAWKKMAILLNRQTSSMLYYKSGWDQIFYRTIGICECIILDCAEKNAFQSRSLLAASMASLGRTSHLDLWRSLPLPQRNTTHHQTHVGSGWNRVGSRCLPFLLGCLGSTNSFTLEADEVVFFPEGAGPANTPVANMSSVTNWNVKIYQHVLNPHSTYCNVA